MAEEVKTKAGFLACRRCDSCGTRINNLTVDTSDRCVLKCTRCGKEYRFRLKAGNPMYTVENLSVCYP